MLEITRLLVFATYISLVFGASVLGNDKYPMEKGHHVIDNGERVTGDEVLYSDTLLEPGKPMRHIGNEYCYPPRGSIDQVKLSEYEIKDLDQGNDGGVAFDVSGGVGQNQVCFFLKTQYGKGYRFKIDIYGFKQNGVRNIPISAGPAFGAQGNPPTGFGSSSGTNLGSGFGNNFGMMPQIPGANNFQPGGNNFQPGGNNFQPFGNNFQPGGNNFQPGGSILQPGGNNFQPAGNNFQPGGNNFQPFGNSFQPGGPIGNYGGNFGGQGTGNFGQPGSFWGNSLAQPGTWGGSGAGSFAQTPGNYGGIQFPVAGFSGTPQNYGGPNSGNLGSYGGLVGPTGNAVGYGGYGSTAGSYGSGPDQFRNGKSALGDQKSSGNTVQSQNTPNGKSNSN